MDLTAIQLANLLQGTVEGNEEQVITHPAKIESANNESIAFLANMKYEEYLYTTNAGVVLIDKDLQLKDETKATLVRVDDAYSSFVKVLTHFQKSIFNQTGVHQRAYVHPEAKIGENVYIAPFTYVDRGAEIGDNVYIMGNCSIGQFTKIAANTTIYPNVTIYHYCEIGSNCIIHSSSVIGSDGFGFAPLEDGSYAKIPQVGNVVIGNDVEIGSNTSIDRATMGSTIIKDGVKIDNLVQIAHNVVIEENTVIASQAGISGSTKIGKQVIIGGQAGFVGHIEIANGTKVNAKSGVLKTIQEENTSVSGTPAFPLRDELRSNSIFRRLPEIDKRLSILEKKINQ